VSAHPLRAGAFCRNPERFFAKDLQQLLLPAAFKVTSHLPADRKG